MPSEFTSRLGLELQETGENINTWGEGLNNGFSLVDEAVAGVAVITLTGNYSLTTTLNASNEARKAILVFLDGGLSAIPVVTVPARQKLYYVENRGATHAITFTAGGATAALPAGRRGFVLCTGTDVFAFDPVGVALDARDQAVTAAANAGSAASSAAGHASAASTARAGAEAAYDAFDDRYLGAKSSPPTLDNDGNALLVGAIYFDTTLSQMRVRNTASQWQVFVPTATDYLLKSGGTMTGPITFGPNQILPTEAINRTSNSMLTRAGASQCYNLTGTFDQTFDTGSNLGRGCWFLIRNTGAGIITLKPAAGELIDGVAESRLYQSDFRLVMSSGFDLKSARISEEAGWDLIIEDRRTPGTSGGTNVAGSQARALNTVVFDRNKIPFGLSSDILTITKGGVFEVDASAPAYNVAGHQITVIDAGGTALITGTSEYVSSSQSRSSAYGIVTLADGATLRVSHSMQGVGGGNGLGMPRGVNPEVYTQIKLKRVR